MNAAPASVTTATSTGEVAHIAYFRRGEFWRRFEYGLPKRALCGTQRPPRPDCDYLPICPRCRQLRSDR